MSIPSMFDERTHSLLEPPSPAYSNVTVRRAFVVWMYCGQRNKFKDVCNYFHYLEALEEKLPAERRASSRHHEFHLFSNQPPSSTYLSRNFPKLYTDSHLEKQHIAKVEAIKNEKCLFRLEGFDETAKNGTSTHEIVNASRMIRAYCRTAQITLRKFLEDFREHTKKCQLNNTVGNVTFYIKRKMVQAELELKINYNELLNIIDIDNNGMDDYNIDNDNKYGEKVKDCQNTNNKDNSFATNIRKDYKTDVLKSETTNKVVGLDNIWNKNKTHEMKNIRILKKNETIEHSDITKDDDDYRSKERRFSGSHFVKIDTEMFRKI